MMNMKNIDEKYMKKAIEEAKLAMNDLEVPVGCVIVKDGEIIGKGHNTVETTKLALSHAEILAIKEASEYIGDWRLNECTMYVTLEPCAMCSGAIVNSRIKRLVIGTMDEKRGCCGSIINLVDDGAFNHRVDVETGVLKNEAQELLKNFFRKLREEKS